MELSVCACVCVRVRRYACCVCRCCVTSPVALVRASHAARRALEPMPPHRNQALADTVGAILGEGIAFLAATLPAAGVHVVGLRSAAAGGMPSWSSGHRAKKHTTRGATAGAAGARLGLRGASVVVDRGPGCMESGTVRYHGEAEFAPGTWVGVELLGPTGGNNGTVRGRE